jgi:hypothetical protein
MDTETGAYIEIESKKEAIQEILAQKRAILTADIYTLSTSTILTEVSSLIEYDILVDPDNEFRCPFCGGFYNPNRYTACPHCEEKDAESMEEVWRDEDQVDEDEEDYEGVLEDVAIEEPEERMFSQKDLKTLAFEQLEKYLLENSSLEYLRPICEFLLSNSRVVKLSDHEALCLIDPRIVSALISLKERLAQLSQEARESSERVSKTGLPLLTKERLLDILAADIEEVPNGQFPSYDDLRQILSILDTEGDRVKSLIEKIASVFEGLKGKEEEDRVFVEFYKKIESLSNDPLTFVRELASSISDGQISDIEHYYHIQKILSFLKEGIITLESESKKREKEKTPIKKEDSSFSKIIDTKPSYKEVIQGINLLIDTFLLLDDEMIKRVKVIAGILDRLDSSRVEDVAPLLLDQYLLYTQNLLNIEGPLERNAIIPILKEVVSSIDKRGLRRLPKELAPTDIPVLSIRKTTEGALSVTLNSYLPPNLEVNPLFKSIEVANFLEGLARRDRLLLSIGEVLSRRQREFFLSDDIDEANLKLSNLKQAEIATEISGKGGKTQKERISRLIKAGILIRTDLGNFPIQYFLITNQGYLERNKGIVEEIIRSDPEIKEKDLLEKVKKKLPNERKEGITKRVLRKFLENESLLKRDRK